jgi:hypothetical protein
MGKATAIAGKLVDAKAKPWHDAGALISKASHRRSSL